MTECDLVYPWPHLPPRGVTLLSAVEMRYNKGEMWPFRQKKASQHTRSRPPCSYCESTNTKVISYYHGTEQSDHIRTWRGQRYVRCRCSDCDRDFYVEEPLQGLEETFLSDDSMIDDEDKLRAAEEDLRRQADDEDDRRYKLNMS